jgi:hypothetical protein
MIAGLMLGFTDQRLGYRMPLFSHLNSSQEMEDILLQELSREAVNQCCKTVGFAPQDSAPRIHNVGPAFQFRTSAMRAQQRILRCYEPSWVLAMLCRTAASCLSILD